MSPKSKPPTPKSKTAHATAEGADAPSEHTTWLPGRVSQADAEAGEIAERAGVLRHAAGQTVIITPYVSAAVLANPMGGVIPWTIGLVVRLNQLVSNAGTTYLCKVAHTAGGSFDAAKFDSLMPSVDGGTP